jgi:hypothetical protein
VFARGPDGALWHIYFDDGKWNDWIQVNPKVIGSAPSAVMTSDRLVVFARGTDGILEHTYYDQSWVDWIGIDAAISSAPSAVMANERLVVFARGADTTLGHLYYSGGWTGWMQISPYPIQTSPSAMVNAQGRLAVFSSLYDIPANIYYDSKWSEWIGI